MSLKGAKQMKSLDLNRYALSTCVATAMLAGCGGSQPPIGAPGAMPQTSAIARHAAHGKSWIEPNASGQDLLYISSADGNVYVYTYPGRRLVGTLTGFIRPSGECVDAAGDVFITAYSNDSFTASAIYEYAHGGTTPIATLNDPGGSFGCAVDPMSGNLAAANVFDNSNPYNPQYGSLAIYTAAKGNPTMYYSSQFGPIGSCGYDDEGNVYLTVANGNSLPNLARLASGGGSITLISLNKKVYSGYLFTPTVQWGGKHMTISSLPQSGSGAVSVYHLSISGSSAIVVGTTILNSPRNHHAGESWIQSNHIIGIYDYRGYGYAAFWPYPKGGNPSDVKRVSKLTSGPLWGVTVSLASSR
jgi:hypothetical protein